MLSPRNWEK